MTEHTPLRNRIAAQLGAGNPHAALFEEIDAHIASMTLQVSNLSKQLAKAQERLTLAERELSRARALLAAKET